MFKVNDKGTRTTSMTKYLSYFTSFSSVSIFVFEQVNVSWVVALRTFLDIYDKL